MVITCVDYFNKIVQLVLLQEFDARTMADRFLSMVASKHRLLDYITNGYNPRFCSDF